MRIVSIVTALIVAAVLFALVMQRDALLEYAGVARPSEAEAEPDGATVTSLADAADTSADTALPEGHVRVMAQRSIAQVIDSAVVLRGQTQAMRQVDVMAETSGKVVSDPLRAGTLVEAGQLLCQLDPGTRATALREARANLASAKAGLPEAAARLAEAKAGLPAAEGRILEAQAAIPAAEAALAEARTRVPEAQARLEEAEASLPTAEARLAEAEAQVPAAEARLLEAQAAVPAAEAALAEAEQRVPEAAARLAEAEARVNEAEINLKASQELARDGFAAQTRLAGAEADFESSKAGVQTALAGLKSAETGIESAKSQLEGAKAGVEAARSQIESARAGVQSAKSGISNAKASIQSARSQIENAKAGIQAALSQSEGARAALISAQSQRESALAAIQGAMTGEESARSRIQTAEAAVATVEQDIERLDIRAPFAGLLETDTAELGALMQTQGAATCATVIQLDPIKLVGFAPETEVSRIQIGALAGARLVDGREVTGQVSFVSRSADQLTRTFRVEISLPNADLSIRDGQTVEIGIAAEGAPAHLLAQSTLTLNDEGDLGVRSIDTNSTAQFMPVKLLRDTREGVWVAGLPENVDVITLGQEYVTDGVPVVPSFEEIIQ